MGGGTKIYSSYESLPPNFSLTDNMLAGAFAGIAVCILQTYVQLKSSELILRQEHSVMYPVDLLKVAFPACQPPRLALMESRQDYR